MAHLIDNRCRCLKVVRGHCCHGNCIRLGLGVRLEEQGVIVHRLTLHFFSDKGFYRLSAHAFCDRSTPPSCCNVDSQFGAYKPPAASLHSPVSPHNLICIHINTGVTEYTHHPSVICIATRGQNLNLFQNQPPLTLFNGHQSLN